MYNLYDIMQAAQQGQATNNIAHQFGLSVEQTRKAMDAMLPAFSLGLQRSTETQQGLLNTLGLMGNGQFAPFFDNPSATRSPAAPTQGASVVNSVFGSPDVARQVATHAAVLSGVSPEVLMRMMPLMGAMIMGGLFRSAMEQGMDQFLAKTNELSGRAGARPPEPARPPATPSDNAAEMMGRMVTDSLKAMFSVFPLPQPTPPSAAPAPPTPAYVQTPPAPAPIPHPAATAPKPPSASAEPKQAAADETFDPARAGIEHLNRMFETGRSVQDQHLAAMRTIFDSLTASKDQQAGGRPSNDEG